jgi:hypothetical protein
MALTKDWKDLPASLAPAVGESVKDWHARIDAYAAANPGVLTPLDAGALKDLESRAQAELDTKASLGSGGGSGGGGTVNVKDVAWGPGASYTYGAIGDGVSRPLSGFFSTLAAAQAVYPHATSLGDELDWAACQKAMNSLSAGGRLYHPAGTYRFNRPYLALTKVLVQGDGVGSTVIAWTADLGLGIYAVKGQGGQHEATHYADIRLNGPRANLLPTLGARECGMDGVHAPKWCHMTNVMVAGFGANIVITEDHQKFTRVRSTRGYFNIYFGDNSANPIRGDQGFFGCTFDFAAWANVACHGNNAITDTYWDSTHVGFAPYGFYKFDVLANGVPSTAAAAGGGAVVSTLGLVWSSEFHKVQFESQGNACIHDDSTGSGNGASTLMDSFFTGCFHSWGSGGAVDTYRISTLPRDYAVHTRVSRGTRVICTSASNGFIAGLVATYHIPSGGITVEGRATPRMFSPTSNRTEGLKVIDKSAIGYTMKTPAAVALGDIMEKSSSGYEVARYLGAASGKPVYGVAMHTAGAGEMVTVAVQGQTLVLCEPISLGGLYLVPNGAGVMHRARGSIGWGVGTHEHEPESNPAFAISHTAGGAAGGSLLVCTLLGTGGKDEPGYVQPQAVAALPTAGVAYRGWMLRRQGGAGVADTLHLCEKTAADAYVWRAL